MMPECVVLQQALEMVVMDHGVGPWSNQRHIPAQNVDKLGQLVDARSAKKCADSCHTRVIARRLRDRIPIFLHAHRSELEHHKLDRKSTRLNSSHLGISYAVFCLKKKKMI